jgi:hypothetical protein
MKTTHHSSRCASIALLSLLGGAAAVAQDHADIDRTQITGNRELPKVTYIVPWKKPLPGDNAGRPVASVLDEALSPIDRDVFRRQVRYGALVQAQAQANAAAATTMTAPTPAPATAPTKSAAPSTTAPAAPPAPSTTK